MAQSEAAVPKTNNTDGTRKTRVSGVTLQVLGASIILLSIIGGFVFSWLNYGFYVMELELLAAMVLILMLPFAVGLGLVVVGRRAGSAVLGAMGLLILISGATWSTAPNDTGAASGWLMFAAAVVSGLLLLGGAIATLRPGKH